MVPYLVVGRSDFHLPPGACSSRRRRAAAHVERDGRRPAGGHVRGLGVGARHRAVGRDAGGRQLHLVAARGELTSHAPIRRHSGGFLRTVRGGHDDRVTVGVEVRARGQVLDRDRAGGTAHGEGDGRPAGGHVHGLGVGVRHGAVGGQGGGRQLHLVAARGDPGEGRGPVRRYGPGRRLASAGHGECVPIEVEVRAGGGGRDRQGAGRRGRRTAHREGRAGGGP